MPSVTRRNIQASIDHQFDGLKRQLLELDLDYGLSPEVVKSNLQKCTKSILPTCKPELKLKEIIDWPLKKRIQFYDDMNGCERSDGKKTYYIRPQEPGTDFVYSEYEVKWIINEFINCFCSFEYFFYGYFFIKNKENRIVRPDVLVAQQIFLQIVASINSERLPLKLLILKARQLGISTIVEAIILWIALFQKGCHTVIASAEEDKSVEMSNMVWVALEKLPLWMKPILTRDDVAKGPGFLDSDSDILIQHGAKAKGIARGSTPVAAHLSEVAYYPIPTETIEASLLNAMHENPRTFLALESTARKKGDWFHKRWLQEREGESDGRNELTCIFLPWYVGKDKYPTPDWLRNHPVPAIWKALKETVRQAAEARLYVRTTPLLSRFLGENWEMPLEQMWCWEHRYLNASRTDETLKSFHAEFASDERTCFQSKRFSVFGQGLLEKIGKELSTKYVDYAVTGDGIATKFHLREFQSNTCKRIDISFTTAQGDYRLWRLIPLKETPDDSNLQFFLRVWEPPKTGYDYVIGVDIGGGIGQDASVIDVLRKGRNPTERDVEVAQLWSPWMNSAEMPPFCMALGIWYGTHMGWNEPYINQALMCPETQIATGDPISFQLDKEGYLNFCSDERKDMKRRPGQMSHRRGHATTTWTRPMMTQGLKHGIEVGWVKINSERTLSDLENLEAEELESGKTKYEAATGENDDCYMSLCIAYYHAHDKETMMERLEGKLKPKLEDEVETPPAIEDESSEQMLARRFQREDREAWPGEEEEGREFVF